MESSNQPVVVKNRPGAVGVLGTDMLSVAANHAAVPAVRAKPPNDPQRFLRHRVGEKHPSLQELTVSRLRCSTIRDQSQAFLRRSDPPNTLMSRSPGRSLMNYNLSRAAQVNCSQPAITTIEIGLSHLDQGAPTFGISIFAGGLARHVGGAAAYGEREFGGPLV